MPWDSSRGALDHRGQHFSAQLLGAVLEDLRRAERDSLAVGNGLLRRGNPGPAGRWCLFIWSSVRERVQNGKMRKNWSSGDTRDSNGARVDLFALTCSDDLGACHRGETVGRCDRTLRWTEGGTGSGVQRIRDTSRANGMEASIGQRRRVSCRRNECFESRARGRRATSSGGGEMKKLFWVTKGGWRSAAGVGEQ